MVVGPRHHVCFAKKGEGFSTEVNVIKSFLVGAIAGAAVMWMWGDRIRDAIDDTTADIRSRTAEQLHGVADTLQSVAETVDQGLKGAPQHRVS